MSTHTDHTPHPTVQGAYYLSTDRGCWLLVPNQLGTSAHIRDCFIICGFISPDGTWGNVQEQDGSVRNELTLVAPDGILHREDGPALYLGDGKQCAVYFSHGNIHRLDGPAITGWAIPKDNTRYWVDGKPMTPEEWAMDPQVLARLNPGQSWVKFTPPVEPPHCILITEAHSAQETK